MEFWNCVPHQQLPVNGDARKAVVVQQAGVHALLEVLGLLPGRVHGRSIHDLVHLIQVLQTFESVGCVWLCRILELITDLKEDWHQVSAVLALIPERLGKLSYLALGLQKALSGNLLILFEDSMPCSWYSLQIL